MLSVPRGYSVRFSAMENMVCTCVGYVRVPEVPVEVMSWQSWGVVQPIYLKWVDLQA